MGPQGYDREMSRSSPILYEHGISHHLLWCYHVFIYTQDTQNPQDSETNEFFSMLTPFPMLLKSLLPTRKKVAVLGIFSLGSFVTAIQIIRILTIKSLSNYIDSSKLIMWSMVENNLGIIAASIPTLAPLFRSFRDKSSKGGSRTPKQGRGSSYILQSFKHNKTGVEELGRGKDGSHGYSNTITGGGQENSSEEFILDTRIRKTTEVAIVNEEE